MTCPICKKPSTARHDPKNPNRFAPFCSARCRDIDLGRWLDGKYQIPVDQTDEGDEQVEAGPSADDDDAPRR
jgi:endogenous inhibitor of DNA gyrase (YacG/DUF329 family)